MSGNAAYSHRFGWIASIDGQTPWQQHVVGSCAAVEAEGTQLGINRSSTLFAADEISVFVWRLGLGQARARVLADQTMSDI